MSTRSALMAAGALVACLALALLLDGCTPRSPADVERATARSAITVSAAALVALDVECSRVVRATGDKALGAKCVEAYAVIRGALVGAAVVVDAWANADVRGDVTCAVVTAGHELALLSRELTSRGGKAIASVDDALSLAAMLGKCPQPRAALELGGAP